MVDAPVILVTELIRDELIRRLREFASVRYMPAAWKDPACLREEIAEVDVLVTRFRTAVTHELLIHAPRLKVLAVYGASREHIEADLADFPNVMLVRASEAVADSIAEFTLGLILALLRRIHEAVEHVYAGGWDHTALIGTDLAGRRVLVVGCGSIGARTAQLLAVLGAEVVIARRSSTPLPKQLLASGCRCASLPSALESAEILSLHVQGGASTRNLIGTTELERLPQGAIVINTSRGSVLDLDSLLHALDRGHLSGAALDVLPDEPPRAQLRRRPNLLVTPHLALYTNQNIQRRIDCVVQGITENLGIARGLPFGSDR